MAVTNSMLLAELKRLEGRVNELAASIALVCERMAGVEQWKIDHNNGAHSRLQEQIGNARRVQERQGERLWKVALQVANLAALLATMTKLAGVW